MGSQRLKKELIWANWESKVFIEAHWYSNMVHVCLVVVKRVQWGLTRVTKTEKLLQSHPGTENG